MDAHLWTRLWARELEPDEIEPGTIAMFTKAPRRDGEYGLVDALIAGLDRCPLTHAGIVTASGPSPEIAHSTLAGLRLESLDHAVPGHRWGPVFLFTHAVASQPTIDAVVAEASRRVAIADDRRDAYPTGDLLLAAILLCLRNRSSFDEHHHVRMAQMLSTVVDPSLTGRMCAAFIQEVFAATNAALAPPDERSAFVAGLVAGYETIPALPPWTVELVAAGLADVAEAAALGASHAEELDPSTRDEIVEAFADLSRDGDAATSVAAWVAGVADAGSPLPRPVVRIVDALGAAAGGSRTPSVSRRFTTVNDLVRSPDIVPLGHVIGWADNPDHP